MPRQKEAPRPKLSSAKDPAGKGSTRGRKKVENHPVVAAALPRPVVPGANLPVAVPSAGAQVAKQARAHPHADLDSAALAALGRMTAGLSPHAFVESWADWAMHLARAPGRQLELLGRVQENGMKLARYTAAAALGTEPAKPFAPDPYDTRWGHEGWDRLPFALWQQGFLSMQDWWQAATADLKGLRHENARRMGFFMRQMLDTVSPSNFPLLNPEILAKTAQTHGRNLVEGTLHFADDSRHILWNEHRPVPESHALGRHLATTPGQVVFRNEMMELIQYAPATDQVQAEPVLIVPAWIMKYYILDLSPENSLIGWLVRQGHTVFCISWRNPTAEDAGWSLEDYRIKGVMQALATINAIVPGQRIHATGYCLGGTLLAIAAAAMARDGDDRLASITLMAAQIDFAEAGELLLFLDESQVALLEDLMDAQGYLDRPQMSRAFAAIRAEDLIWSRATRRYFLGEPDLPTDLTVWLNDTTRMPARMHGEYLRGVFLENRITAGRFAVDGRVIALKDIDVPIFVVATESDHIAPWRSVYKTALFTNSDLTFVLTKGGHNGGILSEPGHKGRHYRVGHRPAGGHYRDPDSWLAAHEKEPGSWWLVWGEWLGRNASGLVPAPGMGAPQAGLPPLGPAPGTYVLMP